MTASTSRHRHRTAGAYAWPATRPRTAASFAWANGYRVTKTGAATLSYSTPIFRRVIVVVEMLLWALAVRTLIAEAPPPRAAAAVAAADAPAELEDALE